MTSPQLTVHITQGSYPSTLELEYKQQVAKVTLIRCFQIDVPITGIGSLIVLQFPLFPSAKELDVKNIVNVLHEAEFADGDWELLGLQLIKHTDLTTIKANRHGEVSLCMIDTISQWLRNELEPSWNKLAEAVEKVTKYGKATANVVWQKAGIGKTDFVLKIKTCICLITLACV